MRIEAVADPEIESPDEVLIKVRNVGVCGSDCHFYEHGRIGDFVVRSPLVLGHECSGEIVETGSAVRGLSAGDLVTPEPGLPCRRCRFCKTGRYNLCPHVKFMATPPFNGAFCEYLVWPSDFVFKIPEGVSLEEAATVEPLAVGVYSARRGRVQTGDAVAVLGCGPIGLVTMQACAAQGATTMIASDINPSRLAFARSFGAIAVSPDEFENAVDDVTDGLGADAVFETAGTVATTQQALKVARKGACVVLVGLPPESPMPYDIVGAICKEVDIMGIFRYANCFLPALSLLAAGKVKTSDMITDRFTLDQAEEALKVSLERSSGLVKAMVVV